MTAALSTLPTTLTDAKGADIEVGLVVKAKGTAFAVTRLERRSQRVVLRDAEGRTFARKATTVQILKAHGRVVKAGSRTAQRLHGL